MWAKRHRRDRKQDPKFDFKTRAKARALVCAFVCWGESLGFIVVASKRQDKSRAADTKTERKKVPTSN